MKSGKKDGNAESPASPAAPPAAPAGALALAPARPSSAAPGSAPAALPLFYKQPELLSPDRHGGKSLAKSINFRFARATNSVPLNSVEFALAQRHYPIVFTPANPPLPVAILGLRDEQNLFVNAEGGWKPGHYIPAYVRRYPFVFTTSAGEESFALCVDAASEFIVDGAENPLFENGKPTQTTNNALNFCAAFQAEFNKTRDFCAALEEQKLLDVKAADVALPGGQKLVFGNFRVVNEARFQALPEAVVLDWYKRGWMGLVYAHLLSFGSWAHLTG